MIGTRKARTTIGLTAACATFVLGHVPPAAAATGGTGHTVTMTTHQHGTWTEPGDTDFCTNEPVTPTITGNSVFHVTYFPGGDEVWLTFTETGTATFVQSSSKLTFSGRVTVRGNFNLNNQNSNSTFIANFDLTAVDTAGVTHFEVGHQLAHIAYNAVDPTTPIVSFEKMTVTCT